MGLHFDSGEVQRLAADLAKAAPQVGEKATRAVRATASDIEHTAQALAPVLTGELKGSISSHVRGLDADVAARTRYARFVEYGTSVMAPQPYMGPAFDQHAPDLEHALGDAGEDIL